MEYIFVTFRIISLMRSVKHTTIPMHESLRIDSPCVTNCNIQPYTTNFHMNPCILQNSILIYFDILQYNEQLLQPVSGCVYDLFSY